jgi:CRP/FNR family cyclic AMP-dependent transcriptional regulator
MVNGQGRRRRVSGPVRQDGQEKTTTAAGPQDNGFEPHQEDFMDIEVLRRVSLFASLGDDVFAALTDKLIEVDLPRGSSVFREGDQGDQLYFIVSGKIKLGRTTEDGRENLLGILGPGDLFGELALFDPSPRTATATAVSGTRLGSLKNEDLRTLLETHSEFSAQLLQALARRLRRTNESLADLVFSDVPGRVAKALLDLADRFGQPATEGTLVAHELTQEELAQLVGASRETVNKALAEFVERSWVRLEPRAVVILDAQRLRQRSH